MEADKFHLQQETERMLKERFPRGHLLACAVREVSNGWHFLAPFQIPHFLSTWNDFVPPCSCPVMQVPLAPSHLPDARYTDRVDQT